MESRKLSLVGVPTMGSGNISYFKSEQVDTSAFMTPEKLQQGVASILEEVKP